MKTPLLRCYELELISKQAALPLLQTVWVYLLLKTSSLYNNFNIVIV
jgi:hypothetical protein